MNGAAELQLSAGAPAGLAAPAIEVQDLRVERGGVPVIRDVSFALERGIVAGCWGPAVAARRP